MPKDTSPSLPTEEKQPKRPPNAWILFRSDMNRALKLKYPKATQSALSKQISNLWASAIPEVRAEYERRAEAAKVAHHLKYPNYKFNPRKKEEIAREKQARLQAKEERARRNNARNPQRAPVDQSQLPQIPSLYPTLADFGPNGPSPPVSAAGSPQDFSSREASPAQFTPPLTLPDLSPSHVAPSQLQQAFSPLPTANISLAGPSNWASSSAQYDAPSDFQSSEEPQYNALLQFDLPASQLPIDPSFQQPMIDSSQENMGVALMGTGDSSVFHVNPFDNGIINGQQNLDLNIGVGDFSGLFGMSEWEFNQAMDQSQAQFSENIDFAALFSSLDDTSLVQQNSSYNTGNNMQAESPSYEQNTSRPPSGSYSSYFASTPLGSASIEPSALVTNASTSSQVFEQGSASTSSYAPPSGAAYAGNRRVGGSWSQYSFPSEEHSQAYAVPAAAQ
ncbi:hypothetical protein F5050DRAFT_728302 [Lentinula boryana]|uniref:HMG box domain-containing protein n=1 Tax=Lentinula boryana TaxID=40481 RepID=A0ABQ8QNM3_9AGAR|nr:hypothetical protein F5050DRAFT_728302 [Lentinula boryana]